MLIATEHPTARRRRRTSSSRRISRICSCSLTVSIWCDASGAATYARISVAKSAANRKHMICAVVMISNVFQALSGDQIVAELARLNVRFFHPVEVAPYTAAPARLLASMAVSDEPKLRMALVVLFTENPDLSAHVEEAVRLIHPSPYGEALRLYYQAAVYLQAEIGLRGRPQLADLYSRRFMSPEVRLGASPVETDAALDVLAAQHAQLPLRFADVTNWRNTYRQQIPLHLFKEGHPPPNRALPAPRADILKVYYWH